jgi:hypothetical protein
MPEEEKQAGNISRRNVIASAALVPVAAITSAAQQAAGESACRQCSFARSKRLSIG